MIRILNLQTALFFEGSIPRPDHIYNQLNKDLNDFFSGVPMVLPIPGDSPVDLPVVQLKTENGEYSCNISRGRCDLVFQPKVETAYSESILSQFTDKSKQISNAIQKIIKVIRIGFSCQLYIDCDNAISLISEKYFKENISNAYELSFRHNFRKKFSNIPSNNITEIGVFDGINYSRGLLIIRDINNIPDDKALTKGEIETLISNYSSLVTPEKINELI